MAYSSEKIIFDDIAVNNCGAQAVNDYDYHTVKKRIDYTLMFISSGEVTVYCDEKIYTAKKGDVVFYPPNTELNFEFLGKNKNVNKWIHFGGKICNRLDNYPRIIKTDGNHEFESNIDRLIRAFYKFSNERELLCKGYMTSIIALLIENYERQNASFEGTKGKIPAVLDYMTAHLSEKIDFDKCANMCYLSRSRFNHFFKEYTGMSPYEYFLNLKIERAKLLLYDKGMSTSECAEALGFCNSDHFCRVFKSRTGITPRQFLRNYPQ